jgi:hypothetical protein
VLQSKVNIPNTINTIPAILYILGNLFTKVVDLYLVVIPLVKS